MVFNELTGFVMGLIVIGLIVTVGVVVMTQMDSVANVSADSKYYGMSTTITTTMNEGIEWVGVVIIVAIAVMVLGLLFRVFGRAA
jgi:hypothetical protein